MNGRAGKAAGLELQGRTCCANEDETLAKALRRLSRNFLGCEGCQALRERKMTRKLMDAIRTLLVEPVSLGSRSRCREVSVRWYDLRLHFLKHWSAQFCNGNIHRMSDQGQVEKKKIGVFIHGYFAADANAADLCAGAGAGASSPGLRRKLTCMYSYRRPGASHLQEQGPAGNLEQVQGQFLLLFLLVLLLLLLLVHLPSCCSYSCYCCSCSQCCSWCCSCSSCF